MGVLLTVEIYPVIKFLAYVNKLIEMVLLNGRKQKLVSAS
jgi:hypothetical protein